MNTHTKHFAKLLNHYLYDGPHPMTMRELAAKSGLKSHSLVGESKGGTAGPDEETAAKWAELLGVEDVSEWMDAASIARAATTSTGRRGAAALSARVAALESELAESRKYLARVVAIARKSGLKIPDAPFQP